MAFAAAAIALVGVWSRWVAPDASASGAVLAKPVDTERPVDSSVGAVKRAVRRRMSEPSVDHTPPDLDLSGTLTGSADGESPIALGSEVISGEVLDATGGPIIGASVDARPQATPGQVVRALSDAHGRFRLRVPRGMADVSARSEGYGETMATVPAPSVDVRLLLAPAASLVGSVIHEGSHEPAPGVSVNVRKSSGLGGQPLAVRSEADGSFRVEGLAAGGYQIEAIAANLRSDQRWVTLGVGEVSERVELVVAPATRIRARIQTAGVPCPHGQLELSGPVGSFAPTSEAGVVEILGVPAGSYRATAACDGASSVEQTLLVEQAALELSFDLEPSARITGRVESAGGRPVAGARVGVKPVLRDPGGAGNIESGAAQCISGSDGSFECTGLLAGTYDCEASTSAGAISSPVRVVLEAGRAAQVLLRAEAAGTIVAALSSELTGSVSWMAVARSDRGGATHALLREGEFVFENLPLGDYRVSLVDGGEDDQPPAEQAAVLAEDGQVARVTLVAPKRVSTLGGIVVDDLGAPVPDAWVHATRSMAFQPDASVLSNEQGNFELTRLSAGEYELLATSPLGEAHSPPVAAGARGISLRIERYGSLSGRLTTHAGDEVDVFTLQYERDGQGTSVRGAEGRWSVPWLAPGKYRLTATSSAGSAAAEVRLEPGAHLDVPLVTTSTPAPPAPLE